MKKTQYQSLTPPCSGTSYVLMVCFVTILVFTLFSPTILEFLLIGLIDFIVFPLILKTEQYTFLRRFPFYKPFSNDFNENSFKNLTENESNHLFENLSKYPARRAFSVVLWGMVKVIPAGVMLVYFVDHQEPILLRWTKFILMEALVHIYHFAMTFYDFHEKISTNLKIIYKRIKWLPKLREPVKTPSLHGPLSYETMVLASAFFSSLLLIYIEMYSMQFTARSTSSNIEILLSYIVVGLIIARIYWLSRSFLFESLNNFFRTMSKTSLVDGDGATSLHTFPIVTNYQILFNQLIDKVARHEQELQFLALKEIEDERINAIGNMASLMAHDLVSPLHTIQFCFDEEKEKLNEKEIQEIIKINLEQCLNLVGSIRNYLKNSNKNIQYSNIAKVHNDTLILLATQYRNSDLGKISFDLDHELQKFNLSISQMDLMHILFNLYKNSIESLAEKEIKKSVVKVSFKEFNNHLLRFEIKDNGQGLSEERYNKLISLRASMTDRKNFQKGLGLRLCHSLAHRLGGSFSYAKSDTGTAFHICLPLYKEENARI